MILHIDMDAFFASIEQAINPRLRGKPLIVGSRENPRQTVVAAASYEAKRMGIDSGMPSAEAFKICPDLQFVAADQSKYIWTSERIFELLKEYGFTACNASIDEFQMDIKDTPEPGNLAENIRQKIHQKFHITASIGIAKNGLLAKLASKINKPNGIAILTAENTQEMLAKTPVKKLRGVGPKTQLLFATLGIETCLDIYQKPPQFLERFLGKYGLNMYAELHSTETFDGLESESANKSVGHSYTLARASENTGFIRAWIRLLSEMVGARLRQQNLAARTVHLWLNGPEMPGFGSQRTFQEPTNDSDDIARHAMKIMSKTGPGTPLIRALGVSCSSLSKVNYPPLFNEQKRREALLKSMDKINAKLGDWSIYPAVIHLARFPR
ncbi:MAG: DNA polymerase IV [Candidatus Omnitrophica bacterium]|nr:DNA polymerase IV [Candidatus Omnitrophota bacterium]